LVHPSTSVISNRYETPSLILIGLSANLIFSMQPNLKAATEETAKFDGNWSVTVDIKAYKNGNGSIAEPLTRHLSVTVKDGALRGERGIRTKPGWYELSGKIATDGTATLRADEITGAQKYNFAKSAKQPASAGKPYTYSVVAHFEGGRGTGQATDGRTRLFTFEKE
jgi:hypothetical protein